MPIAFNGAGRPRNTAETRELRGGTQPMQPALSISATSVSKFSISHDLFDGRQSRHTTPLGLAFAAGGMV
jgi:hypothetical protein